MSHRINGDRQYRVQWGQWGCLGSKGGQRGTLRVLGVKGDPLGPWGWFDESSDDS